MRKGASMDEKDIERVLRKGFPAPGDKARQTLLEQCLDVLGQDDCAVIEDDALDMLAAAGDIGILLMEQDDNGC